MPRGTSSSPTATTTGPRSRQGHRRHHHRGRQRHFTATAAMGARPPRPRCLIPSASPWTPRETSSSPTGQPTDPRGRQGHRRHHHRGGQRHSRLQRRRGPGHRGLPRRSHRRRRGCRGGHLHRRHRTTTGSARSSRPPATSSPWRATAITATAATGARPPPPPSTIPQGIAVDAAGNIFIADAGNNGVREVVKATGDIITVAGNGSLRLQRRRGPGHRGLARQSPGRRRGRRGEPLHRRLGNNRVREVVKATGDIITVAGNGSYGLQRRRRPGHRGLPRLPTGVAVDAAGDLFIADLQQPHPRGRQRGRRGNCHGPPPRPPRGSTIPAPRPSTCTIPMVRACPTSPSPSSRPPATPALPWPAIGPTAAPPDVGLYDPTTGTFYLANSNTANPTFQTVVFQPTTDACIPVVGDWTGSGTTTVGLYDPTTSTFYERDSNTSGVGRRDLCVWPGGYQLAAGGRRLDGQRHDHRRALRSGGGDLLPTKCQRGGHARRGLPIRHAREQLDSLGRRLVRQRHHDRRPVQPANRPSLFAELQHGGLGRRRPSRSARLAATGSRLSAIGPVRARRSRWPALRPRRSKGLRLV